ncbi:type 4 prepilin peptidase 1 Aspartic peptidase. MEROPS family A24A [Bryocella elongata]|uniref:Type 4 prepilin peptidase 1 Aspartic peptidase. MEROPS family A24A n=1 Tax=Bryocella elongata TaxID=863522 RepID=A0A1H5T9E0_9BACT|nr:A24 family peptidase [Bryocella elongata]SEF59409.1 type 4 prepilin peptidase 1 Aspartic peptidase. MEROPS family A24A [Bryocella elongata]
MLLPFELIALFVGLVLGSFLNVCIARLPNHESIIQPRSHCPRCLATIHWYDNIPLVSWLLLRARCRACKATIPWRYPLVELGVGVWAVIVTRLYIITSEQASSIGSASVVTTVSTFSMPTLIQMTSVFILGFLLIGLMVMDWQTHTLPDTFTLTGTGIGFALAFLRAAFLGPHENEVVLHSRNPISSAGATQDAGTMVLTGPEHYIMSRLLAIVLAAGLVLAVRALYKAIRKQEGLGLGDAKLMAMIAAFLGFGPSMLALFAGVLLCAFYAASLLAKKQADSQTAVPLGTFLAIGGLFAALLSAPVLSWYSSFF